MENVFGNRVAIRTWKGFNRFIRSQGWELLKRLDEFPNSILVSGCQRSGTTAIARMITKSEGMFNYWFGNDDELDAALILSGYVDHKPQGRYCFQTTYLNDSYHEYYRDISDNKIIWILRNPFSVVYSLLYNWKRYAFNRLFESCGLKLMPESDRNRYEVFGRFGVSRCRRACYSYNGKTLQVYDLRKNISESQLIVLDYDDLVENKTRILPKIYDFLNIKYKEEYANQIYRNSVYKAKYLSKREYSFVEKLSGPVYEKARALLSHL